MNFEAIADAAPAIQLHLGAVILSLLATLAIAIMKTGTRKHKFAGRVFVIMMAVTSISSFWINEIDMIAGFSMIHLLSIFVLINLFLGVRAARNKQIARHRRHMRGTAIYGIGIAGAFTFLPDRLMYVVFLAPLFN